MAILPLIAEPDRYEPALWQFDNCPVWLREYWVGHYLRYDTTLLPLLRQSYPDASESSLESFREDYLDRIRKLDAANGRGKVTPGDDLDAFSIFSLDRFRTAALIAHGFNDPYRASKAHENNNALRLYPQIIEEVDAIDDTAERWDRLIRGIFAGNHFDLGSVETAKHYTQPIAHDLFFKSLSELVSRPWLIDDLGALISKRLSGEPWTRAMILVDNAGSDFVLGVMPLARELVRRGSEVILAANETPALNDITAREAAWCIERVCQCDPQIEDARASGRLSVLSTGSGSPLLDMADISEHCAEVAGGCDLLIIEGMGRALESNFNTRFTVDTIKLAMIKDKAVARAFDGQLFDLILRFEAVG